MYIEVYTNMEEWAHFHPRNFYKIIDYSFIGFYHFNKLFSEVQFYSELEDWMKVEN
jgi:hypothetical protein